ncbi:beta-1 4-galactosyltransferase 2 [Biomphalaria pfeifferi]|uniref:Beta-1,4-galactosyltransferase n=1 Tax=Biomphalaria pfeifferi TaxID=112525 RepID=A0AAD8C5U7_BIOPF|nr:beta-1 4-galactosyltransferase 2 [Biomphalaria pfeifferi]
MSRDRRMPERGLWRLDKLCVSVVLVNILLLSCYHVWLRTSSTVISSDQIDCPSLRFSYSKVGGQTSLGDLDDIQQLIRNWDEMKVKLLQKESAVVNFDFNDDAEPKNDVRNREDESYDDKENVILQKAHKVDDQLKVCAEEPDGLEGNRTCDCEDVSKETLQNMYPELKDGRLQPADCKARERLAIVIPFRDRYHHLHVLINMLIPLLKKQKADVTFFVIEQDDDVPFNRALLQNVGFLESQKVGAFNCYIFHDTDLVPMNYQIMYRCADNPRHFPVALKKYGRRTPKVMYKNSFGGIVALTKAQFLDVNGNSNLYFGWGGEDDDLLIRVETKAYKVKRENSSVYHYQMLKHDRNDKKKGNVDRKLLLVTAEDRMDMEGLSTTKYKVKQILHQPLYIWISVEVNVTEVMRTAPDFTLAVLQPRSINRTAV